MRAFCTEFNAILVGTDELKTFSGPNVCAPNWDLAQQWCFENAGHLKVIGELVEEIPCDNNHIPDFSNSINYENLS